MVHVVDHVLVNGRPVLGVSITIYLTGTTTPATLYSDDGVTLLANPVTTEPDGSYDFWITPGTYDLVPVKAGITFDLTDYVQRQYGGSGVPVALGGSAVATLGPTGGDGPDSSAQIGWDLIGTDETGKQKFYPYWTKG